MIYVKSKTSRCRPVSDLKEAVPYRDHEEAKGERGTLPTGHKVLIKCHSNVIMNIKSLFFS